MASTGRLRCPYRGCPARFKLERTRVYHVRSMHQNANVVLPRLQQLQEREEAVTDRGINPAAGMQEAREQTQNPRDSGSPSPPQFSPGLDAGMDTGIDTGMDGPFPIDAEMQGATEEVPPVDKPPKAQRIYHPYLTGIPCNENGEPLPEDAPPPPRNNRAQGDWTPFNSEVEFRLADLLFRRVEMSAPNINELMELWALDMARHNDTGPFNSHLHMHSSIDAIDDGNVPWQCLSVGHRGHIDNRSPSWQRQEYEVYYRDPDAVIQQMLSNPDFDGQFNVAPYIDLDEDGKRRWSDVMSGNYAWRHSDIIYDSDETTAGAMYCPVILGSDKTTVSVGTGHVEYHPLYLTIGNTHNTIRRGHRSSVIPIGFLAIPKGDREYDNDPAFRTFRRQLYHASISAILRPLHAGMLKPVVRRCPDGHYRRVIYDLAAYIADYPEQVLLAGIVQNWCCKCTAHSNDLGGPANERSKEFTDDLKDILNAKALWDDYGIDLNIVPFTADFPRADIHEMLSPDILHQLIKGTFKDHLVTWIGEYLVLEHGEAQANRIMDDIDRRIAAAPLFPELRRFPHGRRFKQWTGDDSKALMKVYIPAIVDYVPEDMVKCIAAFLDACYLARRNDLDEDSLAELDDAIQRFHTHRQIFQTAGVRPTGFSLPRQHSLVHYVSMIKDFGAPNGLCSSITESRHITAVKKPWRRSNRNEALGQMLRTNQRLDKLAAARADFVDRGMLPPTFAPPPNLQNTLDDDDDDDDGGPTDDDRVMGCVTLARTRIRKYPRNLLELGLDPRVQEPRLLDLTRRFLFDQIYPDSDAPASADVPECYLPTISSKVAVYHSAVATFYAPSDQAGVRGMRRERIRATPSWRSPHPRYDCALVVDDDALPGFRGLSVVRVKLLFSFSHEDVTYPCALVEWFKKIGDEPDPVTGMWRVKPEMHRNHRLVTVVHLDSVLRGAHLLPVFGGEMVPLRLSYRYTLDLFRAFYVNKYADHHMNEVAF